MSDQESSRTKPKGKKIIGIDLGTTFSCCAHIDQYGKPEIILNNDNNPLTASAVLIEPKGENESELSMIVGQLARDNAVAMPSNVVTLVKREMGRSTKFSICGRDFSPEEISAIILKKLGQDAHDRLGIEIKDVVITVPAYFGAAEIKATQDAGEMAGFTVHYILKEPVAAALAFGFRNPNQEQTFLVYDLGGGTFDITLFKMQPAPEGTNIPGIEMISTGGNHDLGGANWDERIMDYVAEEFMQQHGLMEDPRDDLATKQDLLIKAEKAKCALSKRGKSTIVCQHNGKTATVEIDLDKLLEKTGALLALTETDINRLLNDTGYTLDRIDQVLLVGGSTRLKMVQDMLGKKFGDKVNNQLDADQCVAQGAAWMGYLLSSAESPEQVPVQMVVPHAFAVWAKDENNEPKIYPLIPKDAKLPDEGKSSDTFYTASECQTTVEINVYECEARTKKTPLDPDAGRKIGQVIIEGLPECRPAGQQVDVTFEFDSSQRLKVTAKDVSSGKNVTGELNVGSGIDLQKKQAMGKLLDSTEIQS
jgi:molecular chaperone DnaK